MNEILELLTPDIIVKVTVILLFTIGLGFLFYEDFKKIYLTLKNIKGNSPKRKRIESDLDRNLRLLLEVTAHDFLSVKAFKIMTGVLWLLFLIICSNAITPVMASMLATLIAFFPYLVLKLKLEHLRSKSSGEAEILIQNLMIQYRIKNFNMAEGIEALILQRGIEGTKKLLVTLLIKLRGTKNKLEIKEATSLFAYSIGTNWGKMLGSNIYRATVDGGNVSESLEDILIQLREARVEAEERKRINAESGRMLYLVPIAYVGSVWTLNSMLGMPFRSYLYNQFGTKQGIVLFLLILLLGLFSYLLVYSAKSKKFDF